MYRGQLPLGLRHRARFEEGRRGGEQEHEVSPNIDGLEMRIVESAIVLLKFRRAGNAYDANGFFVHVPGAQRGVIFTAGHNLVDEQGSRSTELRVWWQGEPDEVAVAPEDVRISAKYEANPTPASAVFDYGAILLPKPASANTRRPGFGFALKLAEEEVQSSVNITTYKPGTPIGPETRPVHFIGGCTNPQAKSQIEHDISTEPGVSGSPIWVGYKKYPTVVGIHNYGKGIDKLGKSGRGTRLTLSVMREIFGWAGALATNKQIRVVTTSDEDEDDDSDDNDNVRDDDGGRVEDRKICDRTDSGSSNEGEVYDDGEEYKERPKEEESGDSSGSEKESPEAPPQMAGPLLFLTWSPQDHIIRVVVGESLEPKWTRFFVLPVYASPLLVSKQPLFEYAFGLENPPKNWTREPDASSQEGDGRPLWVSWDIEQKMATLVTSLRQARLARWERQGDAYALRLLVRRRNGEDLWEVIVRTDSRVVMPWDLGDPGTEFTGLDYKTLDDEIPESYNRFVLV
ncbi:hypothetical protein GGS23DRAFT_511873 [Durotheca rogersii]|uniref:uncharacterized protein n=1 Tax=Durotheca rogersii TaxID=419775 RepID=UPI0022200582|nr:uncharacterized protein GGS23DRAFT_511873 [Durotheca rogersii]KAI5863738.1 hypothetical protein GGS23DRAFT_511873 [Durotheca rogersii]